MIIIRLILSLIASHSWFINQLDVNPAFLHDDLDEEVYMKIPPGIKIGNKTSYVN